MGGYARVIVAFGFANGTFASSHVQRLRSHYHFGRTLSLRLGLILTASLFPYFHPSLLHTADTIGYSTDSHDRHPFWNIEGINAVAFTRTCCTRSVSLKACDEDTDSVICLLMVVTSNPRVRRGPHTNGRGDRTSSSPRRCPTINRAQRPLGGDLRRRCLPTSLPKIIESGGLSVTLSFPRKLQEESQAV